MIAKKCIIWGMEDDYDRIINNVRYEILKGNIEVLALVCQPKDKYCATKDGFTIITPQEIDAAAFDYLIIANKGSFKAIKNSAIAMGIKENRIINGEVLLIPMFDFARYIKLLENPVTILSDDCFAGYVYNHLGLQFSTPLINIYWEREEYAKFIEDPLFYLNTELRVFREGSFETGVTPIGQLGDDKRNVKMVFLHNNSFAEAKEQWDRRKARINKDNIFVKMGFSYVDVKDNAKEILQAYDKVKYNKILFYSGTVDFDSKFSKERFYWSQKRRPRVEFYSYNDYMRRYFYKEIDILKLLTGEEDYIR